jgi:MoxR-like ATPase
MRTVGEVVALLRGERYIADRGLATAVFLALDLRVPLLLEGEPGVGKTEVAKALASASGRRLVRLQCYEGIDAASALYEWDYPRQLLHLRVAADGAAAEDELFSPRFLLERPLLAALRAGNDAVLLIDEIDRADDAFEAFLLELLSDFQITIPEIGTVGTTEPPIVILTSNRTRDLHDALRRRCLYHWIDYPSAEREQEIVLARAPNIPEPLRHDVTAAARWLRELDLFKAPGISETITWARALAALGLDRLDRASVSDTLSAVLKDHDDLVRVSAAVDQMLDALPVDA